MTYKHKLSKRLAVSWFVAAALPLLSGCETTSGIDADPQQIVRLLIQPRDTTAVAGTTVEFTAIGTTAGGETVLASVQWSVDSGNVKGNGKGKGFYKANGNGKHKISASTTDSSVTDSTTITIVPDTITAVRLSPRTASLAPGGAQRFSATATHASGVTEPVTVAYTATGGAITGNGTYTADSLPGTFVVVGQYDTQIADTAVVTVVSNSLDLTVSEAVDVDSVAEGGGLATFTVTVENLGPITATGVTVGDTLPAGLTYASHAASDVTTYLPTTGEWTIGSLGVGEQRTLTLTATANARTAGTLFTNTAAVESAQTDTVSANDTASASVVAYGVVQQPPPPPGDSEPQPPTVSIPIESFSPGDLDGGGTYLDESFDRYTTTVADMVQGSSSPYGTFSGGQAWTAPSNTTGKSLITGRLGSGVAIRSEFSSGNPRPIWQTPWISGYLGSYAGTIVLQYWVRFPDASGFYDGSGGKFFEMWYVDNSAWGRIQLGIHGTFAFNPGHATRTGPSELGHQPVGPYPSDINDGGWHRVTIAYRPHTSWSNGWNGSSWDTPSSRDGFARAWIDGTKIVDVSATAAGITPTGGTKVWCTMAEVDALGATTATNLLWLQLPEYANGITGTFNFDIDDLKVWTIR